jgi:hypothetical protein
MRDFLVVGPGRGYNGTDFKYWPSIVEAEADIGAKAAELGIKLVFKREEKYAVGGEERYKRLRISCKYAGVKRENPAARFSRKSIKIECPFSFNVNAQKTDGRESRHCACTLSAFVCEAFVHDTCALVHPTPQVSQAHAAHRALTLPLPPPRLHTIDAL